MLDEVLKTLLETYLVPITGTKDNLIGELYAPISTFNSRIDLAYRIGLITARFSRDLHLIRRIRNDFAHDIDGCNFENTDVQNRVLELSRSSKISEKFAEARDLFPKGARGEFQFSVSIMLFELKSKLNYIVPISSPRLEFIYKDSD